MSRETMTMPRRSSFTILDTVPMRPRDRTFCVLIADIVIIQSIFVFVGSGTVIYCVWKPDQVTRDYDKLIRIMYLFDHVACGYELKRSQDFTNLKFSNDTQGYKVRPIKWLQPVLTVSTRLSGKTRKYIKIALALHCLWVVLAIILWIYAKHCEDVHSLKFVLAIFFYSSIFMIMFDTSMALVYIAHIKQSLTNGMVLRHSGWSNTVKLSSHNSFAGWLPMLASICWMRGILIFMLNVYCCKIIKRIRRKIRRREIRFKYGKEEYRIIPEAKPVYLDERCLVYRSGVQEANRF